MKSFIRKSLFSDLDLDFKAHPSTGDVTRKVDAEAVKRSIRNLVLTNKYDKPFHPEIDARVTRLLFEPATPLMAVSIRSNLIDLLNRYEPRAKINDVMVVFDDEKNAFEVQVSFMVLATREVSKVFVSLERLR
jgi:phage baseplate assembly protein W